jgi:hypothetical protein
MEFTSINDELFFKNVYTTCYENLPFFQKTIVEFNIQYETLLSTYKSLKSNDSNVVNKLKLEGGQTKFGIPCFLNAEYLDSLIYGKNKTEDEKKSIQIKFKIVVSILTLFFIVSCMFLYLYNPEKGYHNDAKITKIEIEKLYGQCTEDPLDWNSSVRNILNQLQRKCGNDIINEALEKSIKYVLKYYNSKLEQTWPEYFYSVIFKLTSWKKFISFIRVFIKDYIQESSILVIAVTVTRKTIYNILLNILNVLGFCFYDEPNKTLITNGNEILNEDITKSPKQRLKNRSPSPSSRQTRSPQRNNKTPPSTPTFRSTISSRTPFSLAPTPPQPVLNFTPPSSPSRNLSNSLRQRRSSKGLGLRGGKKNVSRKKSFSRKRKSRSKSLKFNFQKKSKDLLEYFYKNSETLNLPLSGGLRKGFLCNISSFGATVLFLTLIIFFIKVTYENLEVDKEQFLTQLRVFINKVPFFKQFSRVLFDPNESFTTFFYNIVTYANTVALTLPPIVNFVPETFVKTISIFDILKLLGFAFSTITKLILSTSIFVAFVLKNLMKIFEGILCKDEITKIEDTTINDEEEKRKLIELIEESTKIINTTNLLLAIKDMKPKRKRTKIIL